MKPPVCDVALLRKRLSYAHCMGIDYTRTENSIKQTVVSVNACFVIKSINEHINSSASSIFYVCILLIIYCVVILKRVVVGGGCCDR